MPTESYPTDVEVYEGATIAAPEETPEQALRRLFKIRSKRGITKPVFDRAKARAKGKAQRVARRVNRAA